MNSFMGKIRSFIRSYEFARACDECRKHDNRLNADCDGCYTLQKERESDPMTNLTYN